MSKCEICGKNLSFFEDTGMIDGKKACNSCVLEAKKNRVVLQQDSQQESNVEASTQQVTAGFTLEPQVRQMVGLMGCVLLFIGVFMPLIRIPFIGDVNYLANGKGDGIIILVLAVVSLFLVLSKNYKGLYFTGLASAGLMIFTFINIQSRISDMKVSMNKSLAGNPFRGIADAAAHAVQIQWGWAFLILGVILLLIAAAANSEVKNDEG